MSQSQQDKLGEINQSFINEKTQCGCSGETEAARTHHFPSESDAVVEHCRVSSQKINKSTSSVGR
jgi:hypothetical protein